MLNAALMESEVPDPRSQVFSRQLYVDSITYLLRGLPPDLNEKEISNLQSALPEAFHCPQHRQTTTREPPKPSVLHRSISKIIVLICVLIRLALPYISYLLALAYSYERTHRVTENALDASVTAIDSLSRKSMDVTGAAMENRLITGAVTYCIEGICGGLNDGLGEGMKAFRAQNES